ncbi:hypothetical protein, partial [Caballeronia grimmiae]|uniref:hypothetical protein n=1 Tax=Caballeronia grimmiae TaxID=1071679 RepID=UPI0038B71BD4
LSNFRTFELSNFRTSPSVTNVGHTSALPFEDPATQSQSSDQAPSTTRPGTAGAGTKSVSPPNPIDAEINCWFIGDATGPVADESAVIGGRAAKSKAEDR